MGRCQSLTTATFARRANGTGNAMNTAMTIAPTMGITSAMSATTINQAGKMDLKWKGSSMSKPSPCQCPLKDCPNHRSATMICGNTDGVRWNVHWSGGKKGQAVWVCGKCKDEINRLKTDGTWRIANGK